MLKDQIFEQYKNDVNNLKSCAKKLGLSEDEINKIFKQSFDELDKKFPSSKQCNAQKLFSTIFKISAFFAIFAIVIYILLYVHLPTSSIVLRNVQGLIYPGFKFVRFLSVPIIKQFPSLTNLYDESCLIENPYFYVTDMECWPCENVHSVINLTGLDNHTLYQSGTPYIVKTQQKPVLFNDLHQLFSINTQIFLNEANNIKSNNATISNLQHVFQLPPLDQPSIHISWRINKMLPARLIRKLFPRPYMISEWSGQSIERFVMIDGAKSEPYTLPNTECSYIFVVQGSGERTIVLKPSKECGQTCRTISVVLKPSYVLWYNWWYWRPISLPAENSSDFSISYVTSYC